MTERKLIHSKLCAPCLAQLGALEPIDPIALGCVDCQMKLTQCLRVAATHPEFAIAVTAESLVSGRWSYLGVEPEMLSVLRIACTEAVMHIEALKPPWTSKSSYVRKQLIKRLRAALDFGPLL